MLLKASDGTSLAPLKGGHRDSGFTKPHLSKNTQSHYQNHIRKVQPGGIHAIKSFRWKRTKLNKKLCKVTKGFSVSS